MKKFIMTSHIARELQDHELFVREKQIPLVRGVVYRATNENMIEFLFLIIYYKH